MLIEKCQDFNSSKTFVSAITCITEKRSGVKNLHETGEAKETSPSSNV
jgi:hypothetical protein